MKYLSLFGLLLISSYCLALPQFVGIATTELLNVIENLKVNYFAADENVPIAATAPGCNYQDFATKFTQWTSDVGLPQSVNYTSNGQALKDAINAVFAGIDPSDKNAAAVQLDKFCISQRQFYKNLGVEQIGHCIYAAAFVSNGYDKVSAFQTEQVLMLINYQCGPAFKSYTDNIDKYLTAQTAQQTALGTCETQFVQGLNASFINNLNDHGCP
uniref:Uncharacterized protein n=1 Tax=Panagrolaimus sp. ES5 TaxID=591445 RepID=A0AC34F681_9BILA